MDRDETVRALLAEMRARLEGATAQTREHDDAAIVAMSNTVALLTLEHPRPWEMFLPAL